MSTRFHGILSFHYMNVHRQLNSICRTKRRKQNNLYIHIMETPNTLQCGSQSSEVYHAENFPQTYFYIRELFKVYPFLSILEQICNGIHHVEVVWMAMYYLFVYRAAHRCMHLSFQSGMSERAFIYVYRKLSIYVTT